MKARQRHRDVLHHAVAEILLLRVGTQVLERQHGNGWLVGKCQGWSLSFCPDAMHHSENVDWSLNILKALLAQVSKIDSDLSQNLIVGCRRDADTTGFRDALKSGCNIYSIAKNVVGFHNHVADIDADAKTKAPVFSVSDREVMNIGLETYCSPNRLDRTRKFRQEPVTGVLHDAATVFGNHGLDTIRQQGGQFGVCRIFIMVH